VSKAAGPRGREGWGCCICAVFLASMIDRRSLIPRQAVRAWLAGASDPPEHHSVKEARAVARSRSGSRSPSAARSMIRRATSRVMLSSWSDRPRSERTAW
jgi:hypothetical protein